MPDGPVFLTGDAWRTWIDGDPWFPQRFLARMGQPELEVYRVSRAIRDAVRDDYTLLEPLECNDERQAANGYHLDENSNDGDD